MLSLATPYALLQRPCRWRGESSSWLDKGTISPAGQRRLREAITVRDVYGGHGDYLEVARRPVLTSGDSCNCFCRTSASPACLPAADKVVQAAAPSGVNAIRAGLVSAPANAILEHLIF
ncbi:hypothetical protein E2C01_004171 [Portunus trituberculatus]|uniref:Uncharacterized protein n=1 Tax=Portunus trituberculatus TaxID=210409 RepID=A0A5B7CSB9_PORTR|nr:hypothetical protein [Portunus trituberculatus]